MAKNRGMNRGLKRKVEDESSDYLEEDKVIKNAAKKGQNSKNSSSKKSKISDNKKKDNTKTKYQSKD